MNYYIAQFKGSKIRHGVRVQYGDMPDLCFQIMLGKPLRSALCGAHGTKNSQTHFLHGTYSKRKITCKRCLRSTEAPNG